MEASTNSRTTLQRDAHDHYMAWAHSLALLEKQRRSVVTDVFIKSIKSPKCLDEESMDGGK
jgi:hypothetical protein